MPCKAMAHCKIAIEFGRECLDILILGQKNKILRRKKSCKVVISFQFARQKHQLSNARYR